ncbi:protein of unknown function [Shewanella benthica]|uniref:Uncharacterized protein n=1 Tax=Shewanella benthica TaxID=43661 RepID=A0A330M4H7_9GAMM|nr:protein of unknown function [Shewanella benthica]
MTRDWVKSRVWMFNRIEASHSMLHLDMSVKNGVYQEYYIGLSPINGIVLRFDLI